MKRLLLAATILVGCTASGAVNPTLVSDGQLAISALQTIDGLLAPLNPADAALAGVALTVVQGALNDLQGGKTTAMTFAALAKNEIVPVTTAVLTDLKANQTITTGATLLAGLATTLLSDASQPVATPSAAPLTAALAPDTRGALQAWVGANR